MNSSDGKRGACGQEGQEADDAAEDEEPSSSSLTSIQSERSKIWKVETNRAIVSEDDEEDRLVSSSVAGNNVKINKTGDPETEKKARELFLQGVELEQDGKMFDAILKYKKAVHLVPDIEKRAFDFTSSSKQSEMKVSAAMDDQQNYEEDNAEEEDGEQDMEVDMSADMVARLFRLSISSGILCKPAGPVRSTHISSLPFEVLIHILKWVVSSDLDLRSLERCSEVCRGFYLASRSTDIWKRVCLRTWGLDKTPNDIRKNPSDNLTWRQFYLTRPRVQLHGCYIARMSYLRQGERSFVDNEHHRSWHVVQYFRLIRFFAGGKLAMVTTADEPAVAVKALNSRYSSLIQGVMYGNYSTVDDRVVCMVRKSPEKVNNNISRFRRRKSVSNYVFEVPEQDFHFELELSGCRYQRLQWKSYKVLSRYLSGAGAEQCSEFDVNNSSSFPALHFSPVKSYVTETVSPLE